MKIFFLLLVFASFAARADLYRWVERGSGSVKYSSTPPPWYGDPERERGAPAVEVLRYPAAAKPAAEPASPGRQSVELEARRTDLLKFFYALPPTTDLASPGVREQVQLYLAISAELDRLDPPGASRRRAQQPPILAALAGRRAP